MTLPLTHHNLSIVGLCCLAAFILVAEGRLLAFAAQKVGRPPTIKPKVGKPGRRSSAKPEPGFSNTEMGTKPVVKPKEGYLSLTTTPDAAVRLISTYKKSRERVLAADKEGLLNVPKLKPGQYRIEISHADCRPRSEIVKVKEGEPTQRRLMLTEKYGTVNLSMVEPAKGDVWVYLNGDLLPSSRLKIENGMISVSRVPVGVHRISLAKKPEYNDWVGGIEVHPGSAMENVIPVKMERRRIVLTIKSNPGAEVYLKDQRMGGISEGGDLFIPDMSPGTYELRLRLNGYEFEPQQLTLTYDDPAPVKEIKMTPIAEDAEFSEAFDRRVFKWTTPLPAAWKLAEGNRRGLIVGGEGVSFLNNTDKPNRPFNFYFDFSLLLNVTLTNGKGASWVVRAQDRQNYYLFELTTAQGWSGEKELIYYVYKNGKPRLKHRETVVADIGKINASFRIWVEVVGNTVKHLIEDDDGKRWPLGSPFETDGMFTYGGIGLGSLNGLEMYVDQFVVTPKK